jgi:hypothetical protein
VTHLYYENLTRVLRGCFKGVARALQECDESVTGAFQGCSKGVPRVLQWCYKDLTRVLQGCNKIDVPAQNLAHLPPIEQCEPRDDDDDEDYRERRVLYKMGKR